MAYEKMRVTDRWMDVEKVINLDTGLSISKCMEANDETGEYAEWETDENGNVILARDDQGRIVYAVFKLKKRGNIKIVYKDEDPPDQPCA